METVAGIRELKNRLSYYLREVKKGRSISVSERGKIVAIIVPAQQHPDVEKLKNLARSGLGTWRGGKPKGASRSIVVKGKPVGDIVIEDRR
ncbi:MAG TPA: type II toxin-antitoxin system prevent-host-death family antitoxin [Candidatus Eisenbacteria bacterium]|nr:type II toxin-antitoxin system prevent-host-death family antitoxin [Candidatus Eisenbacteria bacterium]